MNKPAKKRGRPVMSRTMGIDISASAAPPQDPERVRRGQGDTVAITVRLTKEQWLKLRRYAMEKGETLQTIAMSGFNRELLMNGEKPLDV